MCTDARRLRPHWTPTTGAGVEQATQTFHQRTRVQDAHCQRQSRREKGATTREQKEKQAQA